MLEIREMRNVQRWNSKLNLDNVEMFNNEAGQWLVPDSSCCISPDLQCCTTLCLGLAGLHIELAGLGYNWLDCGKKQAKGQTASIAFSPDLVQHLTFSIWRPPGENVVQLIHWFGRPTEKKLAVFENVSPQRGCQGCVSYHSLPSTFSLKERLPNSSQSFPWILSHTPDSYRPCLLWHVVGFSPEPWVDHSA